MSVVNVGPPDTEYLYYPLEVEGVTLKGSLLPAHIANNNHNNNNKNFYLHNFYRPVPILLLTK